MAGGKGYWTVAEIRMLMTVGGELGGGGGGDPHIRIGFKDFGN
jgi:hypothetical protein